MEIEPSERISAKDALAHVFFTQIKDLPCSTDHQQSHPIFQPFNYSHVSQNLIKRTRLSSNDSNKSFYQPNSNIVRGNVDTLNEEGSAVGLGSTDTFSPGLTIQRSIQKASSFKPEEKNSLTLIQKKMRLCSDLHHKTMTTGSTRLIYNSSNMQKAAIMNTLHSPSKRSKKGNNLTH